MGKCIWRGKKSDNKFESLERGVEILENFVQSLQGNMKFMEKEFERISKKKKWSINIFALQ